LFLTDKLIINKIQS